MGKETASVKTEEVIGLTIEVPIMECMHGMCSIHAVADRMKMLWSTVYKTVSKILQFYPYKIKHVQEF